MSLPLGPPSVTYSSGSYSNEIVVAAVGINVWNDRGYKLTGFSGNANVLEGSALVRGPVRVYPGIVISITSYGSSDIYVAHEDSRDGGFDTSLPNTNNGWSLVSGAVTNTCCSSTKIWKKTLTADATTALPSTTNEWVGSIYVKSG